MIISELQLKNFRKFISVNNEPGLFVTFHKGLNAIVGENDSGKTAIIDAIKLVLLTQSNEYIRPSVEDFYVNPNGIIASDFYIDCCITDFSANEAKNFIEYLTFEKKDGVVSYLLQLHYHAWREGNRIYSELRAGDADDGIIMDGKARDLLKVVYLKPLRDAEREMNAGRNSRISQILLNHPLFQNREEQELINIFSQANADIERYFSENEKGKTILQTIRENLKAFSERDVSNQATLKTSETQLKSIMESLSLRAPEYRPGLGEMNLLFIAAELVLLKEEVDGSMKLALIEELEAHLHPQAQLRLIRFLQNEYSEKGAQVIISTHSPVLASKINLRSLILLKNNKAYDLAEDKTKLEKGDYLFLQRFLDSTKSNLFFAKGIIMVEGDAENTILPTIADIIGCPLEKNGVSVVNVGSTAFLRYSRILLRNDGNNVDIPVSIITDCDVKQYDISKDDGKKLSCDKPDEAQEAIKKKEEYYSDGTVKAFVSPRWTLEYCLALSNIKEEFHQAIHYGKKIFNSNKVSLTTEKMNEALKDVAIENEKWRDLDDFERAYRMYASMLSGEGKSSIKAIVAQCLASILRWETVVIPDGTAKDKMFDLELYQYRQDNEKTKHLRERIINDHYLKYLVDAIKYATKSL